MGAISMWYLIIRFCEISQPKSLYFNYQITLQFDEYHGNTTAVVGVKFQSSRTILAPNVMALRLSKIFVKHISCDIETPPEVCIMPAAGHWAFPHTRCVMILYEAHYTSHIWRIFHWKIFLSHFKCCPINSKIVMIQNIAYGATACCCCMCINHNDLMVRKKIQSNQLLVILNCEWSIVSKIHSYDGVRKTCQLWKKWKRFNLSLPGASNCTPHGRVACLIVSG